MNLSGLIWVWVFAGLIYIPVSLGIGYIISKNAKTLYIVKIGNAMKWKGFSIVILLFIVSITPILIRSLLEITNYTENIDDSLG